MLKALIIDDEPLAHEVILHHLKSYPEISIVGHVYSASQALNILSKQAVDVLFLDINMPELSGISMLKVMAIKPQVIIITAHKEHAIEGYDLDVADYLLKPVTAPRLEKAIKKVKNNVRLKTKSKNVECAHSILLKTGRRSEKFIIGNIEYLEAYGNFIKLWQGNDFTLVNCTLKELLAKLPSTEFFQIHKSFIINKAKVVALETNNITLSNGIILKVTRSYKKNLHAIFD